MKKVLLSALIAFLFFSVRAQVTLTVGSALLQNPGTDIHIPVTVSGLNAATGGIGVTGIELHISYDSIVLVYDTTLNFSSITPVAQWFFWGNGVEYASNWLEPAGNKLNIPDNTVLFDIVFHYLGGATQLNFDTLTCLVLDSVYNIIPGVVYNNGVITQGIGSGESRWNGIGPWSTPANWSNGIPGDSTMAIVESGQVTLLTNASCKTMTINPGASLSIAPNYSLTVNGNYANNGTFTLVSDETGMGSLIAKTTSSGSGTNNFQCYLDLASNHPHLVSSPVSGATASVFGTVTPEKYTESSAAWNVLLPSDNLQQGWGYKATGSGAATPSFQGNFPTGNISVNSLSYTSGQSVDLRGLNLVGNPYPSAILWEQGSWNKTNLDRAIYAWDGYKYICWNGLFGDLKDGVIPAMQGFFVKSHATGGSLTIPSNARLHSNQPYYKSTEAISNLITLTVENIQDTAHLDHAFVHVFSGSTNGFDGENDAFKLFGFDNYPQIYTAAADQSNLSINTQPDFSSVPVIVKPGSAGSFKILFNDIESFNVDQALFFEDKKDQVSFNIRSLPSYVFTSDGTLETERFVLHFQPVGLDDQELRTSVTIFSTNQTIYIQSNQSISSIDRLDVYDLTGQTLFSAKDVALPGVIEQRHLTSGLYIVKVQTETGIFTKKLFIK